MEGFLFENSCHLVLGCFVFNKGNNIWCICNKIILIRVNYDRMTKYQWFALQAFRTSDTNIIRLAISEANLPE